ncbi:hypothetical protein SUGI_0850440 [Cryptomeria japonica]|nr:hypothetical protein SUGI_0850440 [Cryptomeria japonica]
MAAYEPPDFYEFEVSPDLHGPSTTAPSNTSVKPFPVIRVSDGNDEIPIDHLKTALVAAAVLSFIFLIAKDAHKAFMRRAHWIPCDFLVLSAFSIQMLNMLNTQNQALETSPTTGRWLSIKAENTNAPQYAGWKDILMIHNSRTILCVFTAYVMPAMADYGLEHAWVSIERIVSKKISQVLRGEGEFSAGLAEKTQETHPHPQAHHHSCWRNVKIDVNRAGEHYHLHHVHDHSCLQTVEEALLRAGKADENYHHSCWRTIEDVVLREEKKEDNHQSCWRTIEDAAVRGKMAEEEHHRRHCHYCWRTVEDAVLKAWIIVRAYSVQPVLARSVLTASAAIIVTIQILITLVGGFTDVFKKEPGAQTKNNFKLVATIVQSIFILMAWALINLRWATAVTYHRRSQSDSWRSGLKMEDFWTRHLKELQQVGESSLEESQSLDKEIDQLVSEKQTTTVPSILLSAVIWLQWLLVSFSKACWLFSLVIFHNKLMRKLFSFMFEKHIRCVFEDYPKYEKILKDVQMLGESPESLWVANRKSIKQAKTLIIQGNQDGEYNCEHLVEFLINKRTAQGLGLSCLEPSKPQTGLKYLCKKRPIQRFQQAQEESDVEKQQTGVQEKEPLAVEEQFTDMNTKSWKMTAVSLLSIIVQLSPNCAEIDKEHASTSHDFPSGVMNDCFEAYSQAWEIIDFVEEADTEDDGITSEAADKHFQVLQKKVKKLKEESKSKTEKLKNLKEESKIKTEKEKKEGRPNGWVGGDSIDWKEEALGSAVNNLWDSIERPQGSDVNEVLKELESSLADIINECLLKTQHLLLLNSRKWALKRDEKRLAKALYTAGKAQAIMEKIACNKLAIVSYH